MNFTETVSDEWPDICVPGGFNALRRGKEEKSPELYLRFEISFLIPRPHMQSVKLTTHLGSWHIANTRPLLLFFVCLLSHPFMNFHIHSPLLLPSSILRCFIFNFVCLHFKIIFKVYHVKFWYVYTSWNGYHFVPFLININHVIDLIHFLTFSLRLYIFLLLFLIYQSFYDWFWSVVSEQLHCAPWCASVTFTSPGRDTQIATNSPSTQRTVRKQSHP